jgi:hypothetical protein
MEVLTGVFKNSYDLPYYGVRFWNNEAEANEAAVEWLENGWELISISESKHKIINVKLNNDPSVRVTYDNDGRVAKA